MPNTHSTLTALFTDIANAIREKDGSTTQKVADAFPAAIRAIPSGGGTDVEDGIITREISGEYSNSRIELVGGYVFASCKSLTSVYLPAVTKVSQNAFLSCTSLETVLMPKITFVAGETFVGCTRLSQITFPSATTIGASAFNGCSNIKMMSFDHCVRISSYAFRNCFNLLSVYLLGTSIPSVISNAFSSTPIAGYTTSTGGVYGSIIVRSSMITAFKTASGWSYFSSRFSVWNEVD